MIREFLLIKEHWHSDGGCGINEQRLAMWGDVKSLAESFIVADTLTYITHSLIVTDCDLKRSIKSVKRKENGEPQFSTTGEPIMETIYYDIPLYDHNPFRQITKDRKYTIEEITIAPCSVQSRGIAYRVKARERFQGFVIRFETLDEFMAFVFKQFNVRIEHNSDYENENGEPMDIIIL